MQNKKEYDIFQEVSYNLKQIDRLEKLPAMALVSEKKTIIELLKSFQKQIHELQKEIIK